MTRRWPLLLLALPAGVATWSGWVGLGELTGFGPVKPLPGISDFTINTAVTLPIGVEAYAAYALHAWLSAGEVVSTRTRRFAAWSALGSLLLGMLGQIAYHLLATYGMKSAPWQVTTAVACLPVLVLGMGAALGHMLARDARSLSPEVAADEQTVGAPTVVPVAEPVEEPPTAPEPDEDDVPRYVPEALPEDLATQAASRFLTDILTGDVPGVRRIKAELGVGQEKAQQVRAYLTTLANV
ncbi:hypothetical protein ACFYOK_36050 [Microbispora bryophytorum]|uniref:hypothetical protein n=1 Tax=Microbispora bryophytorum TaxID=1460882 RepID=UPI0033CCA51B